MLYWQTMRPVGPGGGGGGEREREKEREPKPTVVLNKTEAPNWNTRLIAHIHIGRKYNHCSTHPPLLFELDISAGEDATCIVLEQRTLRKVTRYQKNARYVTWTAKLTAILTAIDTALCVNKKYSGRDIA